MQGPQDTQPCHVLCAARVPSSSVVSPAHSHRSGEGVGSREAEGDTADRERRDGGPAAGWAGGKVSGDAGGRVLSTGGAQVTRSHALNEIKWPTGSIPGRGPGRASEVVRAEHPAQRPVHTGGLGLPR